MCGEKSEYISLNRTSCLLARRESLPSCKGMRCGIAYVGCGPHRPAQRPKPVASLLNLVKNMLCRYNGETAQLKSDQGRLAARISSYDSMLHPGTIILQSIYN